MRNILLIFDIKRQNQDHGMLILQKLAEQGDTLL